jgi:hypothetical protein
MRSQASCVRYVAIKSVIAQNAKFPRKCLRNNSLTCFANQNYFGIFKTTASGLPDFYGTIYKKMRNILTK